MKPCILLVQYYYRDTLLLQEACERFSDMFIDHHVVYLFNVIT